MSDRHPNLMTSPEDVARIVKATRRIAVLGIKTEQQRGQPAFYVPEYMLRAGYDIVPVPVYYPDVTEILGQPVYRAISLIPGHVDLVNVFRRARDIPPHLPDILNARPAVVWFQLGIVNDEAALTLARAGIRVVQDRCLLVEHRRLLTLIGNSCGAQDAADQRVARGTAPAGTARKGPTGGWVERRDGGGGTP